MKLWTLTSNQTISDSNVTFERNAKIIIQVYIKYFLISSLSHSTFKTIEQELPPELPPYPPDDPPENWYETKINPCFFMYFGHNVIGPLINKKNKVS